MLILLNGVIVAVAGLFIAAIINYIADVLPIHRRLSVGSCSSCNTQVGIFRYVLLPKCSTCGTKFGIRHFITLLITMAGFVTIQINSTVSIWILILDLLAFSYFILIIVIDIEHHLILHWTSAFGAILMAIIGFIHHGFLPTIFGGFAGLFVMLVLFYLGIGFSKILAKRRGETVEEGLGFGDVLLAGICGLLLGWPGISVGLFTGVMLGGIYSLGILITSAIRKNYQPYRTIPYGPFLALSTMIFWFL